MSDVPLDLREQIARIDRAIAQSHKFQEETNKLVQEAHKFGAESAKLARDRARVTGFLPATNQTFELTNADPQTLRRLPLTQTMFQGLTHDRDPFALRTTHQKFPFGHMSPGREQRQKGTF